MSVGFARFKGWLKGPRDLCASGGAMPARTRHAGTTPGASELEAAIATDALSLAFLPIVDAVEMRTVRLEALLRWEFAPGRFIPPLDFLPMARENGLSAAVNRWVFEQGFARLRQWRCDGWDLKLHLNISRDELMLADLAERTAAGLDANDLPRSALCLELDHRAVSNAAVDCKPALEALRAVGLELVLDNFQLGPGEADGLDDTAGLWHCVKIDRRLMMASTGIAGQLHETVAAAKVRFARTIVQGVDTYSHYRLAREIDCDAMQGYYFCPPQGSDDLLIWFRASERAPRLLPGVEPRAGRN